MTHQLLEIPSRVRVLIVDDDEDDAFIIGRMLDHKTTGTAYEVYHCATAEAAMEEMENNNYDVYLVDYRLGATTGIDILSIVQPELRPEPFILMTGADDQDVLDQSMSAAASDFLVKGSFTAESLVKTINFALQRKLFEQQRIQHLIEINRSKDEFISIASHQLRTPATGVKQYIGMMREGFAGDLTQQQQTLVDKAHESNERQLRIVSDLLRVARVDAGKVTLYKQKTDLVRMVQDVLRDMEGVIRERSVSVKTVAKKSVHAFVDPETMRMVLDNLIENAIKYSDDGDKIQICLCSHARSTTIEIIDTGVGVSESDVPQLFHKFSRIPNKRSTKVGGTGLGLYWALKIVELHGGTIAYTHNHPRGSIFKISLPIAAHGLNQREKEETI